MKIIIVMNNGKFFELITNEEKAKSFKVDVGIYNWLKLSDYTIEECGLIFIRKENICYYQIKGAC